MKTISVNVQITKCPKQYEAVRLGVEVTLEPGENEADAIKTADQFLREQYAALYGEPLQAAKPVPAAAPGNPKPAQVVETKTAKEPPASDKRERLEFIDKRVQQIVRRMEAQPGRAKEILDQTLKYFDPTDEVIKTLNLAAKLVQYD